MHLCGVLIEDTQRLLRDEDERNQRGEFLTHGDQRTEEKNAQG